MPDKALSLLQELLALTQTLQAVLAAEIVQAPPLEDPDTADGLMLISLVQLDQLLDQRQQVLDRLAALPEARRQLTPATEPVLAELARLGEGLLEGLEIQREKLSSSQAQLNTSQSELRHTYSALQAYLPPEQTESHYFEQQS